MPSCATLAPDKPPLLALRSLPCPSPCSAASSTRGRWARRLSHPGWRPASHARCEHTAAWQQQPGSSGPAGLPQPCWLRQRSWAGSRVQRVEACWLKLVPNHTTSRASQLASVPCGAGVGRSGAVPAAASECSSCCLSLCCMLAASTLLFNHVMQLPHRQELFWSLFCSVPYPSKMQVRNINIVANQANEGIAQPAERPTRRPR